VTRAGQATIRLSRNRNYQVLWGSQALSDLGVNAATIALPLLSLAVTGSAVAAGVVVSAIAAARLVAGLPAGALADRWNRRRIMIGCAATQAVATATLVVAVWFDAVGIAHLVAVAAVIGLCAALFDPAEDASLPNLVTPEQLPTAVALKSARIYLGQLSGTAAGGFLYAVGRLLPFGLHALAHAVALVGLLFLRVPPRDLPPRPARQLGAEMAAGLRWVWGEARIRVTTLYAAAISLFFSAFYIVLVVRASQAGVPSGEIGVMAAMLGVGGVVGALLAPHLIRRLNPHRSIIGAFWVIALLTPVAALTESGYLTGLLLFAMALLPPTASTTIISRQLLLTPDDLRGRLSGVLGVIAGVAASLGPVLGGVLVAAAPGNAAVMVCAAGIAVVTVSAAASRTLRDFARAETPGGGAGLEAAQDATPDGSR
jgi:MFS family permease